MTRWSKRFATRLFREASERIVDGSKNVDRIGAVDKGTQILLALKYRELKAKSVADLPPFKDVELQSFSQNGEDGILLYLFSLLGAETETSVEICAGDGIECNTANLIVNHGWRGLLVDGNAEAQERGRRFYARCSTTFVEPPVLATHWVTAENVNQLVSGHGFAGEIDLLSIDMDDIDYWVWKALDCVRPRVVVVEANTMLGPERAVAVPYRPDFVSAVPGHAEASLPAFVKLGRQKGYRLVGCQRYGFNAFFLRADVGADLFPEVPAAVGFKHPHARRCAEEGWPRLAGEAWVEV